MTTRKPQTELAKLVEQAKRPDETVAEVLKELRAAKKQKRPGVPCPQCGSAVSTVTRTTPRGNHVQRIRLCENCNRQFITRESTGKNDTGVMALNTGVMELLKAIGVSPNAYLHPQKPDTLTTKEPT